MGLSLYLFFCNHFLLCLRPDNLCWSIFRFSVILPVQWSFPLLTYLQLWDFCLDPFFFFFYHCWFFAEISLSAPYWGQIFPSSLEPLCKSCSDGLSHAASGSSYLDLCWLPFPATVVTASRLSACLVTAACMLDIVNDVSSSSEECQCLFKFSNWLLILNMCVLCLALLFSRVCGNPPSGAQSAHLPSLWGQGGSCIRYDPYS